MKNISRYLLIILTLPLFSGVSLAQTEDSMLHDTSMAITEDPSEGDGFSFGVEREFKESDDFSFGVEREFKSDEDVNPEELGLEEVGSVPGDRFYFLKNLRRGFQSLITFDPEKEAELNEKFANEKALEIQALVKRGRHEQAADHMESYEKNVDKMLELADKIEDGGIREAFAEKSVGSMLRHQDILEKLEGSAPEDLLEKVRERREMTFEAIATNLASVGDDAQISQIVERALNNDEGSAFKNLKHLDVLNRVGEKLPENAREALKDTQDRVIDRFTQSFNELDASDKEKLGDYVSDSPNNKDHMLRVMDQVSERNRAIWTQADGSLTSRATELQKHLQTAQTELSTLDQRKEPLGDVEHSSPRIEGGPELDLPILEYEQFREDHGDRPNTVETHRVEYGVQAPRDEDSTTATGHRDHEPEKFENDGLGRGSDPLDFTPQIQKKDVFFEKDETGSMEDEFKKSNPEKLINPDKSLPNPTDAPTKGSPESDLFRAGSSPEVELKHDDSGSMDQGNVKTNPIIPDKVNPGAFDPNKPDTQFDKPQQPQAPFDPDGGHPAANEPAPQQDGLQKLQNVTDPSDHPDGHVKPKTPQTDGFQLDKPHY